MRLCACVIVCGCTRVRACVPCVLPPRGAPHQRQPMTLPFMTHPLTSSSPSPHQRQRQPMTLPLTPPIHPHSFKPLTTAVSEPGEFLLVDFAKFDRPPVLHVGVLALSAFEVRGRAAPCLRSMRSLNARGFFAPSLALSTR